MPIPVDKLEWMEDLLIKTGNLSGKVDFTKLIDPTLRVDALKLAGS